MPQTKKVKREKALNNLLARLQDEQNKRSQYQTQVYYTIPPSHIEFNLMMEVNNLKRKLGMDCQSTESPF